MSTTTTVLLIALIVIYLANRSRRRRPPAAATAPRRPRPSATAAAAPQAKCPSAPQATPTKSYAAPKPAIATGTTAPGPQLPLPPLRLLAHHKPTQTRQLVEPGTTVQRMRRQDASQGRCDGNTCANGGPRALGRGPRAHERCPEARPARGRPFGTSANTQGLRATGDAHDRFVARPSENAEGAGVWLASTSARHAGVRTLVVVSGGGRDPMGVELEQVVGCCD